MKALVDVVAGVTRIAAATINAIHAELRPLQNLSVGPGLEVRKTPAAVTLSLSNSILNRRGATADDCAGGTPQELACVQATLDSDSWTRDTAHCPVTVTVITDVQYDLATHVLAYRNRTIEFDKCGHAAYIGAESQPIPITTAEAC